MSGPPIPPKSRRSKRMAAIEAANKIKKIAHDDLILGEQLNNADLVLRNKKTGNDHMTPQHQQRSQFFHHQGGGYASPSLSMPLSQLSLIDENFNLSESINYYDFLEKTLNNPKDTVEREIRRQERLKNSTGPMIFSRKTEYRMSLSPKRSPLWEYIDTNLILTPFADIPTTPMHVYQYLPGTASRTLSARRRPPSSSSSSRFRSAIRRKDGRIKPRKLI